MIARLDRHAAFLAKVDGLPGIWFRLLDMSDHMTLSDLVSDDVPDGVRQLCEQLEAHGWYPRKRWAETGVVYYRDGERSRQLIVDVRYEPNEHKLAFWSQHTGIELQPTK